LLGHEDHVHLAQGDKRLRLALERTQTRLGRCEGWGDAVALSGEARELLALRALSIASRRGWVCPLIATVCDGGALAHHAGAGHLHGLGPWGLSRVERKRSEEERAIRGVMPSQASAREHDGPPRAGTPVTSNRMEAKPMAGAHCRCWGDASAP